MSERLIALADRLERSTSQGNFNEVVMAAQAAAKALRESAAALSQPRWAAPTEPTDPLVQAAIASVLIDRYTSAFANWRDGEGEFEAVEKAEKALRAALATPAPVAADTLTDAWNKFFGDDLYRRLNEDAAGVASLGRDMWFAWEAWNAAVRALATPARAIPAESGPWHFRRFVAGEEMAEDVMIEKAATLDEAVRVAARICPKRPLTVLVHARNAQGETD